MPEKNHYIVVGEKLNTEICKQVTVSLVLRPMTHSYNYLQIYFFFIL